MMSRPRRNAAFPLSLAKPYENDTKTDSTSAQLGSSLSPSLLDVYGRGQTKVPQSPPESVERYKLVVVGDEACGKTALLNTLVKSSDFEVEDATSTTFDVCVTDIRTLQEQVEFTLYEITGMDNYSSLRIELYRGADVFLVCFDIGRPETLTNIVDKWIPEITDEYPEIPYLIVGCKNDLRSDAALLENQTSEMESVSRTKAEMVSRTTCSSGYVECCAKTRWNIDVVFRAAAEAILAKDDQRDHEPVAKQHHSVLRRFSRLASNEKQGHAHLKRPSLFSFVVGSGNQ